jgi:hypothetical protein
LVHTSPAPDDAVLSPLTDSRVSALELRDATSDALIAHARFDPAPAGKPPAVTLDVGKLELLAQRDLRMLALGAAGQQVLGQALHRSVSWGYGEQHDISLELRRPLFFFGGNRRLIAPTMPMSGGQLVPDFAPNKQLYGKAGDELKLRVIDPNAGTPLLANYDLLLDSSSAQPATAAAGTFDGQSLLVASQAGNLHIIDTLQLADQNSVPLGDPLPVQNIVVDPMDRSATLLSYVKPTGTSGRTGHIAFVSDLPSLRSRKSNGNLLGVDIAASAVSPAGAPLSAAYSIKDGLVDVIVAVPPLQLGQPDCTTLSGDGKALLQRYDPATASLRASTPLPYTTAISYTASGDRVLVQPCTKAPGAMAVGQIVITKQADGSQRLLPAPGSTDVVVVGDAVITVGSEDRIDGLNKTMQATVRILEPNATTWATSQFAFAAWQVPFRVTTGIPHAVDILFAPTNVLVYSMAVSPDRARALVMVRVQHQTDPAYTGLFLDSTTASTCYVGWNGYTYHVLLINLQSGAREQDYLVGVQNQTCGSTLIDNNTKKVLSNSCFAPCDSSSSNPYLIGYQDGYIPAAASVLFGRL